MKCNCIYKEKILHPIPFEARVAEPEEALGEPRFYALEENVPPNIYHYLNCPSK